MWDLTCAALRLVAALVLAGLRIAGWRSQSFQAIAHLYVGALIGGFLVWPEWLDLVLAVGLSLVELYCFLTLPR